MKWDEYTAAVSTRSNRWATSDRGWLWPDNRKQAFSTMASAEDAALGHYLDYGPNHYRSPHEYCGSECRCAESQPGSVHAYSCVTKTARYFRTVAVAKAWLEQEAARKEAA
jgi:hypothetical protein